MSSFAYRDGYSWKEYLDTHQVAPGRLSLAKYLAHLRVCVIDDASLDKMRGAADEMRTALTTSEFCTCCNSIRAAAAAGLDDCNA